MRLLRYAYLDTATLGRLTISGYEHSLRTIERPWLPGPARGGTNDVSCVPDGRYLLARRQRANGDPCLILRNPALGVFETAEEVPASGGRSLVEVHAANLARELKGCIAPGLEAVIGTVRAGGSIGDSIMVTSSRSALQLVLAAFDAGDTELEILPTPGARDVT